MKIAWFCIPAYGHTNPTLALVKELSDAGHEVYYFSFQMFKEQIEKAGAIFIGCDDCQFEMEDKENSDRVGKDKAFAMELLVSSTLAMDPLTSRKIEEIQPDLIVSDSVAYWGKLAAKKHNIPYVCSTTTFAFNRYSARYMPQSAGELLKLVLALPKINRQLNRLRAAGYPVKNMLDIVQNDNETNTIVYTSPEFQPCAQTFSEKYCFIGPSMRPIEKECIKTKPKLIYVSMGTVNQNPEFYRSCIRALADTDWQVIVSMGSHPESFADLPENIEIYPSVDQMAVLSKADAFITHCGMNSVSEALYYEVPLVLFPQTQEQEAVARRTEELKAGIRLKSVREEEIQQALETVLHDPQYKQNAAAISQSFHACKGTRQAREFLEAIQEQKDC